MENFKKYFEKKLNEEIKFKVGDKVKYSVNGEYTKNIKIVEIYPNGQYYLNNGHTFNKDGYHIDNKTGGSMVNKDGSRVKLELDK